MGYEIWPSDGIKAQVGYLKRMFCITNERNTIDELYTMLYTNEWGWLCISLHPTLP